MGLFKKAAVFTDIHFGNRNNSLLHNEDCLNFIKWFIVKAKEEGCETCFFLGDYSHHRSNINMMTLQYCLRGLELLNDNFEQTHFIVGNHDLFYRDRRDVYSVEWANHLPKVNIVNDWFIKDDVVIAPWLVGDDYKKLSKLKGKYLFGHFELPHFLLNGLVEMPDHGGICIDHVSKFEKVFTGHFHKRQHNNNVWYIGNAFPHNYSDAGDYDRGMMILEWGGEPEFHAWPDQPTYAVFKLSEILNDETLLKPNASLKVHMDIPISYEEASLIKNTYIPTYNLRELSLIPVKNLDQTQDAVPADFKFESVEQIITSQITQIESDFYDSKLLLELYHSL